MENNAIYPIMHQKKDYYPSFVLFLLTIAGVAWRYSPRVADNLSLIGLP